MSGAPNAWPKTRAARLAWLENRLADWTASAAELGIGDDEIMDLTNRINAARAALTTAQTLRSSARSATTAFYEAADPMAALGGALIQGIRARAQALGDPGLYTTARIDPKAAPSPAPTPMVPTEIETTLDNLGSITIRWKSVNPKNASGTSFVILRKLGGADHAAYRQIGATGRKSFTDATVPPGTPTVHYVVRAVRGDKMSDYSEPVTVYLGQAELDSGDGLSLAA